MAAVLQQLPRIGRRSALTALTALTALAALALSPRAGAAAPAVVLAGRMGERALLVVDGQALTVGVGQTVAGVKLRRWVGDDAELEQGGTAFVLRVGATPGQLGAVPARTAARELALTAGPGGHFTASGAVNGKPARFMVDTGATLVSMGRDEALRLGVDLSTARRGVSQTANGPVPIDIVVLSSVRVGELELANVGAAVMPQPMPTILLGNSFLSRLQMRREADVMRLELR